MQQRKGRIGKIALRTSLHADRSGVVLIYVTMLLPVIIGFSLLAVDVGRVYILNSSLQHGADAIALAMAAELDGAADSIERAERARDNIVSNPALFTDSFGVIDENSITRTYLRSLPASDALPITSVNEAGNPPNPSLAKYVAVTVNVAEYDTIFPASFVGAVGTVRSSATAVAGFTAGACNIVPMFICNPLEPSGNTIPSRITELQAHVDTPSLRRRLIELKSFANTQSTYSPGNFGYLDTDLGNRGARSLNDAISQAIPGACIAINDLKTKPGNTTVTNAAFNTRFDMYGGSFKRDDAEIRPAQNTRKSWVQANNGNNRDCRPTEVDIYTTALNDITAMGFPRDSCMVTNTCGTGFGGRVGNGDWNNMYEFYKNVNSLGNLLGPFSESLPSRYDVYKDELAKGLMDSDISMSAPSCYNNASVPPNDAPDRRLLFAAIANCIAQPLGSGSTDLTAVAIGQFFLTEPVGSQGSIYAELVGLLKPGVGSGSNGVLITDNVQLYR